jgi:hypothetical protein
MRFECELINSRKSKISQTKETTYQAVGESCRAITGGLNHKSMGDMADKSLQSAKNESRRAKNLDPNS